MYDEAQNLYKECGRYDLLNKLHQDRGQWDASLQARRARPHLSCSILRQVAKDHDRIHLRNTYYKQAKHHEHLGEVRPCRGWHWAQAPAGHGGGRAVRALADARL